MKLWNLCLLFGILCFIIIIGFIYLQPANSLESFAQQEDKEEPTLGNVLKEGFIYLLQSINKKITIPNDQIKEINSSPNKEVQNYTRQYNNLIQKQLYKKGSQSSSNNAMSREKFLRNITELRIKQLPKNISEEKKQTMKKNIYNMYSCTIALRDNHCNPNIEKYKYNPAKDSIIQKINKEIRLQNCHYGFERNQNLHPSGCGPYLKKHSSL